MLKQKIHWTNYRNLETHKLIQCLRNVVNGRLTYNFSTN